jgi:hypothetical protein
MRIIKMAEFKYVKELEINWEINLSQLNKVESITKIGK